MIPDSFLRFYKDSFGMQAYSPHFKRIFYYLSEKQDLLDWVVEPFDEKSKISDLSCRVPAPKGTHFINDSLRYKTESVLDDYPETVVVSVKDFLTDKATLILPLNIKPPNSPWQH